MTDMFTFVELGVLPFLRVCFDSIVPLLLESFQFDKNFFFAFKSQLVQGSLYQPHWHISVGTWQTTKVRREQLNQIFKQLSADIHFLLRLRSLKEATNIFSQEHRPFQRSQNCVQSFGRRSIAGCCQEADDVTDEVVLSMLSIFEVKNLP